ncbi:mannonate dehydratase [Halovivax sp.]|uniref:mannonate dehydratase n=1 Tax=Halovivax sp. TaxID=1935978 RepID=UPI0025BA7AA5|nr:mannonate dehydratase [Halovivax sp.]
MEPALILPPERDERWALARQMGVEKAVVHPLEIGDGRTDWTFEDLLLLRNAFDDAGLEFAVMEGSVPITDRIRLGREGRDEDIETFCEFLRHCGALDVPIVAYDWMAGIRWARTSTTIPARGDSFVTGYDDGDMRRGPDADVAPVSADQLWEALEHFLEAAVPVAEDADVMLALHPDDPPIPEVRGVSRIIRSPEAYERVLGVVDSEHNGITFCQGNFSAMEGVDVVDAIRRLGDRITYVHFRDVEGEGERFVETWHDAGPTDMRAAVEAYRDVGFEGPARPDHVPTMAGESNANPGYETKGRLFAIGYMKGLLESAGPRGSDAGDGAP